MGTEEMSRSFDIAYNNIMSNQAPGLSESEKSSLLTKAQEAVIIALYNGMAANSFEETEEYTTYLSPLVRQQNIDTVEEGELPHIVDGSYIFMLPDDMMFRTYESCVITSEDDVCIGDGKEVLVVPVTQDEFWRTRRNPFRNANARKVLRLAYDITGSLSLDVDTLTFDSNGGREEIGVTTDNAWNVASGGVTSEQPQKYVELISKHPVISYKLRYIRYPNPIILEDLPEGMVINGHSLKTPCELNPQIHQRIVDEAVLLAKSLWS